MASGFSKHTYVLDTPVSPWVVINKARPLEPQDYVPPELLALAGIPGGGDQFLIPEAADALGALYAAADASGAGFRISTAYRSYNQQAGIYNSYVRAWGRAAAETYTARPGYSEHQTGRAVDIYTSEECKLKACFSDSAAAHYVAAHAHEYGFIVRYPAGKDAVTGYRHEPWHLRYVGPELATEMFTTGPSTMEEFFGLPPAPDYLD
jgi:D-alanyl-D-alanine carboxypeptidase